MPTFLLPPRLIRWALSLLVLFVCVMTLLRIGTFFIFDRGHGSFLQTLPAFWLGLRFDTRVVGAALLPLLALGAIPFLNPFRHAFARRLWVVFFSLFSLGLIVFYVSDYVHQRYLGQRLNASALGFLADARISLHMAWESFPLLRITALIVIALIASIFAIRCLQRRAAAATPPGKIGTAVWFILAIAGCAIGIFGRLGQYPLRWSDAFDLRNEASANLALNPVESFTSSLNFRTAGFDAAQVRAHYAQMAAYLGVSQPDPVRLDFTRTVSARTVPGQASRPNIVLVLCESFSGYKSSMWGNPLDPTPFFNSLTQQGLFFDNCYTPHFGTARGVWALITGIPDVSLEETASRNPAMVDQHTIIDDFAGYEKFYFLGGSSSWANIRGLLTNNISGLKLYEENSYESPRIDVWGISDKNLFLEADKVFRTRTQPFFAVIQTADNHRPYTIPAEDAGEFQKVVVSDESLGQSGFESLAELNAFRYSDFAIRKFIEKARTAPYFENTLFVFIGDHGIGGDAGRMFPASWTTNHLTRFHVPLLFYGPKFVAPQRIHTVASMVDVLPTIAGLSAISYRNTTFGRDLLLPRTDGSGNVAFIMDHNDKTLGIVKKSYYGVQRYEGGRPEMVWSDFATGPAAGETPSENALKEYQAEARAFYETARYLLLNNKKMPTAVDTSTPAAHVP